MSKLEAQKALPRRKLYVSRPTDAQRKKGWIDLPDVVDVLDPRHSLAKRKAKKAKRK